MRKILFILIMSLILVSSVFGDTYTNSIPIPDKYLMPDGSITTWSGETVSGPDANRASIYIRAPYQIAKWLLPDGSIVAALPFSGGTGGTMQIGGSGTITLGN